MAPCASVVMQALPVSAKNGLSRGGRFIRRETRVVCRRVEHDLRIFFHFLGDRLHRIDKEIHLRFVFAFGGLDHQARRARSAETPSCTDGNP